VKAGSRASAGLYMYSPAGAMRPNPWLRRSARIMGLALVLLLTGCATYYWTRPGTTQEQFFKDSHECAQGASPRADSNVKEFRMNDDLYRACLFARGYHRGKYFWSPTPSWRGVGEGS